MSAPTSNASPRSSSGMADSLHLEPPFTPRGLLLRHPALIWIVAGLSLLLAGAAAFDHGSVLLIWDEPIQEWVESRRTERLETVFRSFSRMGSNIVIFAAFAIIVALTARRCLSLALALTVAVLARPAFEFVLKEVIARDRPDLDRLVTGTGFSHPSGHVLAAVTLWGLLPPLIALVTQRRWVWWIAVATSFILIAGISASRMFLGVHWFSDIVQGLLLGWLYLALIESLYLRHHRNHGCLAAPPVNDEPSLCSAADSSG
jgi:undecaprenyl-diphosphatase